MGLVTVFKAALLLRNKISAGFDWRNAELELMGGGIFLRKMPLRDEIICKEKD